MACHAILRRPQTYPIGYLVPSRLFGAQTGNSRGSCLTRFGNLSGSRASHFSWHWWRRWSLVPQQRLFRGLMRRGNWQARSSQGTRSRAGRQARMQSGGTESGALQTEPNRSVTFIRARHILLESEQMANTVLEQIRSCSSAASRAQLFSSLARSLSTCETRTRGGDLGWFRRGQMVASFEAACLEAALNEPFKTRTEFGWHVVEVLEFGSQRGVISPEDFAEVYRDPEQRKRYQLIDVREPGELEIVSLDDFMNLPLNEYSRWRHLVEGNPDQAPALDPSRPVIVMCHHGIRSATMCAYLCQQGFKDVLNLLGGIDAYAVQIDPSLRRY